MKKIFLFCAWLAACSNAPSDKGLSVWQNYFQENPAQYALFDVDHDGILEAFTQKNGQYAIFSCGASCQNVRKIFEFSDEKAQHSVLILENVPIIYAKENDAQSTWHIKLKNSTPIATLHAGTQNGQPYFSFNQQEIGFMAVIEIQEKEFPELNENTKAVDIQTLTWQG